MIDKEIDEVLRGSARSGKRHDFLSAVKADSGIEVDRQLLTKCSRAADVTKPISSNKIQ